MIAALRRWWEGAAPLLPAEPSALDLADGVGVTPDPFADHPMNCKCYHHR